MNSCQSAQVPREAEGPGDQGFPRGCERAGEESVFGLYMVCTLAGIVENRHMQVAPPIGILWSLVHGTVT